MLSMERESGSHEKEIKLLWYSVWIDDASERERDAWTPGRVWVQLLMLHRLQLLSKCWSWDCDCDRVFPFNVYATGKAANAWDTRKPSVSHSRTERGLLQLTTSFVEETQSSNDKSQVIRLRDINREANHVASFVSLCHHLESFTRRLLLLLISLEMKDQIFHPTISLSETLHFQSKIKTACVSLFPSDCSSVLLHSPECSCNKHNTVFHLWELVQLFHG